MRNLKTLLELLLEDFTENKNPTGLCAQINRINCSKMNPGEKIYLREHIEDDMKKRFGIDYGWAFDLDTFSEEKPLRIEWLNKMINES